MSGDSLPKEAGLLLDQVLTLVGFFCGLEIRWSQWNICHKCIISFTQDQNKCGLVFFHLAAMFFQRKHLSVSLSPFPFLTMTEPVSVRLEKHPFTQPHASLRHWEVPFKISKWRWGETVLSGNSNFSLNYIQAPFMSLWISASTRVPSNTSFLSS